MALEPLFSLTPRSNWAQTYDPANPDAPWAEATFMAYGMHLEMGVFPYKKLYDRNEILLGYDPVPLDEQVIEDFDTGVRRRSTVHFVAVFENVSSDNQFLFVFGIRPGWNSPTTQFFSDGTLVDARVIGEPYYHAILVENPYGEIFSLQMILRMASSTPLCTTYFMGVTCYLL